METALKEFTESLHKFLGAVETGDAKIAGIHLQFIEKWGEMLVINPEFRRSFYQSDGDVEPMTALKHLRKFLQCVTDARMPIKKRTASAAHAEKLLP